MTSSIHMPFFRDARGEPMDDCATPVVALRHKPRLRFLVATAQEACIQPGSSLRIRMPRAIRSQLNLLAAALRSRFLG